MGQDSLKRLDFGADQATASDATSDLWVSATPYDHMTKVARDARNLIGALNANVEWLRAGFEEAQSRRPLQEALEDIETCCERLSSLLEDALLGARTQGLSAQRSTVNLSSLLAAAAKKVQKAARAKQVSLQISEGSDVAAMLDRTLLTRAFAKLMSRAVADVEPGTTIGVRYRQDGGQIQIAFGRVETTVRPLRSSHTLLRPSVPASGAEPIDSEIQFCRMVAEAHGGMLTIGSGLTLYRIALPLIVSASHDG